jgi:hypothetical protein
VEASASLEDVEGSEAPENESGELRGTGETASRHVGTKQAKRRKLDHARDSKLVELSLPLLNLSANEWKSLSAGTTSL